MGGKTTNKEIKSHPRVNSWLNSSNDVVSNQLCMCNEILCQKSHTIIYELSSIRVKSYFKLIRPEYLLDSDSPQ